MNEQEIKVRNKMIELTEPYCFISLPYIFHQATQYRPVSTSELKFLLAISFLKIIFVDFREIFKLTIEDSIQDILPDGQKKTSDSKVIGIYRGIPTQKQFRYNET